MKVLAPAKVNLTLEVVGRRSDGYHALRSVVMPVSLADELDVELTNDGSLSSDAGYADDLCLKAARLLKCRVACLANGLGARIRVTKRIPVGGGLGGGSADAAAVLLALNALWRLDLTREELVEIGVQVGSDVPALVLGGPVLMEGRGEQVTPLPVGAAPLPALNLVIANPGVASSTREVYAACAPRRPGAPSATAAMVAALGSGDAGAVAAALHNDLLAPAVRLHPEIGSALAALKAAGATGVAMSGSGASVFGLVPDGATAARIAAGLAAGGLAAWPVTTLPSRPAQFPAIPEAQS
ncbi:MAG: 4-(cytidine 5'-diphospho)-2-C-methyl-D-erythritol kinase [Kiritimatiellia bacterium]